MHWGSKKKKKKEEKVIYQTTTTIIAIRNNNKIFHEGEEITNIFQICLKYIHTYVKEAQRTQSRINTDTDIHTPKYIRIKLLKVSAKEKIIKATRKNKEHMIK